MKQSQEQGSGTAERGREPLGVAVVGAGYWGVNHVRTFAHLPGCELVRVCDPDPKNRTRAAGLCPSARGQSPGLPPKRAKQG